jgi:hypothetical protein
MEELTSSDEEPKALKDVTWVRQQQQQAIQQAGGKAAGGS